MSFSNESGSNSSGSKLPNLYSQISEYNKKASGGPREVPLNEKTKAFTHDYVIRSLDPELSDKAKEATYDDRVSNKTVLLTNPLRENKNKSTNDGVEIELDKESQAMAKLIKSQKRKTINSREKRALKIYDIPKSQQRQVIVYKHT
ncbi:hypothetical protein H4219_001430 [Mycoemilia scoparia]|uniref:Uncharacterized protein n=1 Tax=Mycoemilia scoparia TaxID=417184 RepID=A0A9W8A0B0_9FUNG|nr:hypothetical protein H4219_001430 [Mycoemilia scoparia]